MSHSQRQTDCLALLKVSGSGLLFSTASCLCCSRGLSIGVGSQLWGHRRHTALTALQGVLGFLLFSRHKLEMPCKIAVLRHYRLGLLRSCCVCSIWLYKAWCVLCSLAFMSGHFTWALSLMVLFSGRGYWQELVESLIWVHCQLQVVPSIQPRALSITKDRATGIIHFLGGGIGVS